MNEFHLFAGIGGGIYAGTLLKNTCVGAVEIDTFCQDVLYQRQIDGWMEPFPIFEDLTKLSGKKFKGKFDLLCGGFPCQAFSTAARGRNIHEKDLWHEMFRFIKESNAPLVFAENVAEKAINIAKEDLESIGYTVQTIMVSNYLLGIEHRRNRYWLLAVKNKKTFNSLYKHLQSLPILKSSIWDKNPSVCGNSSQILKRKQLKGIGNAQSPFVAAVALRLLANRIKEKKKYQLTPSVEEISLVWKKEDSWIKKNFNIIGLVHTPTTMANYSAPSMMKHQGCRNFVEIFDNPNTLNAEWLMGFPIGASSPNQNMNTNFDFWKKFSYVKQNKSNYVI